MIREIIKFIREKEIYILISFCLIVTIIAHSAELTLHISQTHMLDLARSFLHGKLTVSLFPNRDDLAFYNGNYYVYFGFFPALLLMPLVVLFHIQSQWGLIPIATLFAARCLYLLAKDMDLSPKQSLWIVVAFFFGTIYFFLSLVDITAYYIQVLGIDFLILALYFFICKKQIVISSLFFCFAFLTRQTLLLAICFFIAEMIFEEQTWRSTRKNFLLFCIPVIGAISLLSVYNSVRFGSPFDNGYAYNIATKKVPIMYGLFSLRYIPANIYFMLFKGLDGLVKNNTILRFPYYKADYMGLGMFFTSPFFFYVFLAKFRAKHVLSSLITILVLASFVLLFYNSGFWQYGYRYALDFYPFLFLILISVFRKYFTNMTKISILYAICFNAFFMFSIWGTYPFLPKIFWFHN